MKSKDTEKPVRGRPFPKGVSGNPGGRKRVAPEVTEALHAGNMFALERLWQLMQSKNERIALTAALGWLLKTVPNAEKLMLTGANGGPIRVEDARTRLVDGLIKRIDVKFEPKELPEGK